MGSLHKPAAHCLSVASRPAAASWLPPVTRPTSPSPAPLPELQQRRGVIAAADKQGGFGDELLDFMYAGKKLRKWYGEEGLVLPQDGKPAPNKSEGSGGPDADADSILVVDADCVPMAEQVLLQLILARAKLKALVRDAEAASVGFGPYVDIQGGSSADAELLRRALRGVKSVVLCGVVAPALPQAAAAAGVQHLVLLSAVGSQQPGGFAFFGDDEMAALRDTGREERVVRSGLPYTIVRVGALTDEPGGASELRLTWGAGPGGTVAREDVALVLARAACRDPGSGSVTCTVSSARPGAPPEDWAAVFGGLRATAAP